MRKLFGVLIALVGIALGIWIDLWVFFIGGIVQVVEGVTATPVNGGDIAWGLVKALVFTGIGGVVAFIFIVGGVALATSGAFKVSLGRKRKAQAMPQSFADFPSFSQVPHPGHVPPSGFGTYPGTQQYPGSYPGSQQFPGSYPGSPPPSGYHRPNMSE